MSENNKPMDFKTWYSAQMARYNNIDAPSTESEIPTQSDQSTKLIVDSNADALDKHIEDGGRLSEDKLAFPTHPRRQLSRRTFLKGGAILLAGFLAGGTIDFALKSLPDNSHTQGVLASYEQTPNATPVSEVNPEDNPYHIGEGQPINGKTILPNQEYWFQEEMAGYLDYVPDGQITYWTTKDGNRRYLLPGGDAYPQKGWTGNATYMLETDGTKNLKDVMLSGTLTSDSFTQVFAPNVPPSEGMEGEWYAGIMGAVQNPKNLDELIGVAHVEERQTRNDSGGFNAKVVFVKSEDGGKSWARTGITIEGVDTRPPGYIDQDPNNLGKERVTGAGEPSIIYNPVDGYCYAPFVLWRATKGPNEDKRRDEVYLTRFKMNDNWDMGNLEYWTTDGWASQLDNNTIEPIITVTSDSIKYFGIPKISWSTSLNQWHISGETNIGFGETVTEDISKPNFESISIIYNFSAPITEYKRSFPNPDVPGSTPGPAEPNVVSGKPHGPFPGWNGDINQILQPGDKWDSYPTMLSEQYPNSTIIGANGTFYHSTGENETMHEPSALDFTIETF